MAASIKRWPSDYYAERACLDVEIRAGGPMDNHRPLIAAGRLDFYTGGNMFRAVRLPARGRACGERRAAIFQPVARPARPSRIHGVESFADSRRQDTLLIAPFGQYLLAVAEEQLRPR
jgi:hypothetical protein